MSQRAGDAKAGGEEPFYADRVVVTAAALLRQLHDKCASVKSFIQLLQARRNGPCHHLD